MCATNSNLKNFRTNKEILKLLHLNDILFKLFSLNKEFEKNIIYLINQTNLIDIKNPFMIIDKFHFNSALINQVFKIFSICERIFEIDSNFIVLLSADLIARTTNNLMISSKYINMINIKRIFIFLLLAARKFSFKPKHNILKFYRELLKKPAFKILNYKNLYILITKIIEICKINVKFYKKSFNDKILFKKVLFFNCPLILKTQEVYILNGIAYKKRMRYLSVKLTAIKKPVIIWFNTKIRERLLKCRPHRINLHTIADMIDHSMNVYEKMYDFFFIINFKLPLFLEETLEYYKLHFIIIRKKNEENKILYCKNRLYKNVQQPLSDSIKLLNTFEKITIIEWYTYKLIFLFCKNKTNITTVIFSKATENIIYKIMRIIKNILFFFTSHFSDLRLIEGGCSHELQVIRLLISQNCHRNNYEALLYTTRSMILSNFSFYSNTKKILLNASVRKKRKKKTFNLGIEYTTGIISNCFYLNLLDPTRIKLKCYCISYKILKNVIEL